MATNYPSSLDTSTSLPYPAATDNTNSPSLAGGQDNQNDALIAIETLVGTNASQTTPAAQYNVLQATSSSASEWAKLTSDNVSTLTGSGKFVFDTSPTISSPTLSSPTISTPTFSGSLGNIDTGTITASGAVSTNGGLTVTTSFTATGLVTFADLATTIFSGQVQSYTNSGTAGGSGNYINLGGIKILYFTTSGLTASSDSTASGTIIFPSSLFSATPVGTIGYLDGNATASSVYFSASITSSGTSVGFYNSSTSSATVYPDLIFIGT